jgi:hypothetical protein
MSTSRAWFVSIVFGAAATVVLPASGQGFRGGGRVTDAYARAAEALIGAALPGATRDWSDDALVWPDGRREPFRLGGFTRLRVGDTWWAAGALDFPARLERAVTSLRAGRARVEAVRSRLIVIKATSDWRVLDQRALEVDTDSLISAVDDIEIEPSGDERWPQLRIRAASGAQAAGMAMIVWWMGQVDAASGTWTSRVPGEVWYRAVDGREHQELLQPTLSAGTLELRGATSGRRFAYACAAGPCKVRPLSLLDQLR